MPTSSKSIQWIRSLWPELLLDSPHATFQLTQEANTLLNNFAKLCDCDLSQYISSM